MNKIYQYGDKLIGQKSDLLAYNDELYVNKIIDEDTYEEFKEDLKNYEDDAMLLVNGEFGMGIYIEEYEEVDFHYYTKQRIIMDRLDWIKHDIDNVNYEVEAGIKDFKSYIAFGGTRKERLQIFMMLYMAHPTLKELKEWTLDNLLDYINDTDDKLAQDWDYIEDCKNTVLEVE